MSRPVPGPYYVLSAVLGVAHAICSQDGTHIATVGVPRRSLPEALRATAHLLAASWQLREALRAVEWSGHGEVDGRTQPRCPRCGAAQAAGHATDCAVDLALRKARGETGAGR